MIVKEYWDKYKDNGIFWLGENISILAHEVGFLKLEKIGEFYGDDLKKASQVLGVSLRDLEEIRRIINENKSQKPTS